MGELLWWCFRCILLLNAFILHNKYYYFNTYLSMHLTKWFSINQTVNFSDSKSRNISARFPTHWATHVRVSLLSSLMSNTQSMKTKWHSSLLVQSGKPKLCKHFQLISQNFRISFCHLLHRIWHHRFPAGWNRYFTCKKRLPVMTTWAKEWKDKHEWILTRIIESWHKTIPIRS